MIVRISSAVTTRWTPGKFFAPPASMDLMRPCATVLRKIFPNSMPGKRMVWVYSASPLTLACASRRGNERPTCPPPMLVVGIATVLQCCEWCRWGVSAAKRWARTGGASLLREWPFGVWPKRRRGLLHKGESEHRLDRDRAIDLLGVSERLPRTREAVDVD